MIHKKTLSGEVDLYEVLVRKAMKNKISCETKRASCGLVLIHKLEFIFF